MNQREKLLAGLIGAMLVGVVLYYGFRLVNSTLDSRDETIMSLQAKLRSQKKVIRMGKHQAERLQRYRDQSLPEDVNIATREYSDWLLKLLDECRIDPHSVQVLPRSRSQGDVYKISTFSVTGKGDIRKVTRLLHAFYSADYLHRLRSVRLTPQDNSDDLMITMAIDALSVKGAGMSKPLEAREAA